MTILANEYVPLRLSEREYIDVDSHQGISVSSIVANDNGTYTVSFFNTNYNNGDEVYTHHFEWYLSYRGKRVSDYFPCSIKTRRRVTIEVPIWPETVPNQYKNYVTVQFGRELPPRDSRDDY